MGKLYRPTQRYYNETVYRIGRGQTHLNKLHTKAGGMITVSYSHSQVYRGTISADHNFLAI